MSKSNQVTLGHGTPYDRGMADSYYRRDPFPHKVEVLKDRHLKEWHKIVTDLTHEEQTEYFRGFNDNEKLNHHKEWF